MLVTDSAEARFDFAARKDLYAAYLPFALAAGAARVVGQEIPGDDGNAAAATSWYHSSGTSLVVGRRRFVGFGKL